MSKAAYDPTYNKDTVYDEETYKAVVAKYGKATDLSGIMTMSILKKETKGGVAYPKLTWKILNPQGLRGMGIFTVFNKAGIPIRSIPKKGDTKDPRAENEGMRLSWGFQKKDAGVLGEAMSIFAKAWSQEAVRFQKECDSLDKKEKSDASLMIADAKLCLYSRTHYSKKNKEHAGEPLPDETFGFKFSFGTFPENHPYGQKGAPKVEIYDARTKKANVEGKSFNSYALATVPREMPDGSLVNEPINAENIHEFVNKGSRVILQKFVANSPSASNFGFALKNEVWKVVILPGSAAVPEDEREEEECDEESKPASTVKVLDTAKTVSPDEIAEDLNEDYL